MGSGYGNWYIFLAVDEDKVLRAREPYDLRNLKRWGPFRTRQDAREWAKQKIYASVVIQSFSSEWIHGRGR